MKFNRLTLLKLLEFLEIEKLKLDIKGGQLSEDSKLDINLLIHSNEHETNKPYKYKKNTKVSLSFYEIFQFKLGHFTFNN